MTRMYKVNWNLLVAIRNREFFIVTDKRLNRVHNAERDTGKNEVMGMPPESRPSYIFFPSHKFQNERVS